MNYLGLIEHDGKAWGGTVPDLERVTAAGHDRDQVIELLQQALALHLYELNARGIAYQPATSQRLEDLSAEYLADFEGSTLEGILLEPAPLNPVSLEIERLIERSGLRDVEVARRMGTSPASIHRLKNPFYWGHGTDVLRRFARVMGQKLEISFIAVPSSAAD
jgi:antitoxin HicB